MHSAAVPRVPWRCGAVTLLWAFRSGKATNRPGDEIVVYHPEMLDLHQRSVGDLPIVSLREGGT